MKKKIIIGLLATLVGLGAKSQVQYLGTPSNTIEVRGKLQVDTSQSTAVTTNKVVKNAYFWGSSITNYTSASSTNYGYSTIVCGGMSFTQINNGANGMTMQKRTPINNPNFIDLVANVTTYNPATDTALFIELTPNDAHQQQINGSANYNTVSFIADATSAFNTIMGTKAWPAAKIHVISCTWSDTTTATIYASKLIQDSIFNAGKTVCTNLGLQFIDVYNTTRNLAAVGYYFNINATVNNVHPGNSGHSAMAEKILNVLKPSVTHNNQIFAANGESHVQSFTVLSNDTLSGTGALLPVGRDSSGRLVTLPNGYYILNSPPQQQAGGVSLGGISDFAVARGFFIANINRNTAIQGPGLHLYFDGTNAQVQSYNQTASTQVPSPMQIGFTRLGLGTSFSAYANDLVTTVNTNIGGYLKVQGSEPGGGNGQAVVIFQSGGQGGIYAYDYSTGAIPLNLGYHGKSVMVGTTTDNGGTFQDIGSLSLGVTVSGSGTLTLDNTAANWVFSGTTSTWTLPVVTGHTGWIYFIKNRGSGSITLNSNAGGNDLYNTSAVNTITITAGQCVTLVDDGTYWLVRNLQ